MAKRLIRPDLPWRVSPSTPLLRLLWSEGDSSAVVELCADFGPNFDGARHARATVMAVRPPPFRQDITEIEGSSRFRWLRLTFEGVERVCSHSAVADDMVIDEAAYDWSDLGGRLEAGGDPEVYLKSRERSWLESGRSPNPRIYEVEGAPRHRVNGRLYLVLGHDAYLEVEAERFSWVTVQDLPGW